MKLKPIAIALLMPVLGAGCAIQQINETRRAVQSDESSAASKFGEVGNGLANRKGGVIETNAVWLPIERTKASAKTAQDHPALRKQFAISSSVVGITDVAEHITRKSGIPVRVSPDAQGDISSLVAAANAGQFNQVPGMQGAPAPAAPVGVANAGMAQQPSLANLSSMLNTAGAPLTGLAPSSIRLSYDGTLAGFLDSIVTARLGLSWSYTNGRIEIFRFVTKTLAIASVPGDISSRSTLNSSGGSATPMGGAGAMGGMSASPMGGAGAMGGSNAGGDSSTQTMAAADLSIWKSIDTTVKGMLSSSGRATVSPVLGSITVTDYPSNVEMIERFVDQQNAHLSKQVVINVKVYSVTLKKTDNYGINWNAVYRNVANGVEWRLLSGLPTPTGVSTIAAKVVNPMDKWADTEVIAQALSSQGDVSVVTSSSGVTLNNQPIPMRVGKQTAYLASSALSTTASVGQTATLTPGVVTTGFSMSVLPHIRPDGMLVMQYSMDLSNLLGLVSVESAGARIQTPEIESRSFMQRIAMRSGETIVMSGFEQSDRNATSSGIGHPEQVGLGGSLFGQRSRAVIVIMLTANVVDKI